MPNVSSRQTVGTQESWDEYIKYVSDRGVKQAVIRWYVIRVEQYLKAFANKKTVDHGPNDVVAYLEEQGRSGKVKDWQFRQIVDAIQNFFEMRGVVWLAEVDWKYWTDSSSTLSEAHSTIAREVSAEATIEKLGNLKSSVLTEVRRLHRDVLGVEVKSQFDSLAQSASKVSSNSRQDQSGFTPYWPTP